MKIKKLLFVGLFMGLIACTCVGCGRSIKDTVKQWGCEHAYGEEITVETEPTCIEDGEGIVTCTKCGKEKTVTVEKLGHDVVVLEEAVAPTCTTPGKTAKTGCSRCDMVETDAQGIPATGHDIIVLEEAVAPTCTTAGSTAKTGCSRCDFIQEESEEIPAVGHQYGEDKICTVCGESSLPFAYTLSEDGTYYTLSGAGEVTDTDITIPAWHNGLPVKKIGDSAFDLFNSVATLCLNSLIVSEGIEEIGVSAFDGQGCKTVILPKSLKAVGSDGFHMNYLMETFIVKGNTQFDGLAFTQQSDCIKTMVLLSIDHDINIQSYTPNTDLTIYVPSVLLERYQEIYAEFNCNIVAVEGTEYDPAAPETEGSEEVSTETLTVAAQIIENATQAAAIETDGIETDVIDELIETDITMETGVAFNNEWRV